MEPLNGMLLYGVACAVVWVVASKRGRPGWAYAIGSALGGVAGAMMVGAAGGSGMTAGVVAFMAPALGLFVVLASPTADVIAARDGAYRGHRRCPHCAESIKAQALVCKHCGREVAPAVEG